MENEAAAASKPASDEAQSAPSMNDVKQEESPLEKLKQGKS